MTDISNYTVNGEYLNLPVTTDPNAMVQAALATIAANLPGWVPNEGQLDVLLLEQFAQMASEAAQVAAQVPMAIFQSFGSLVGITPIQGTPATAQTTWTMVNSAGYTVPAGSIVAYQTLGNVQVQFQTVNAFTVNPGSTTATASRSRRQSSARRTTASPTPCRSSSSTNSLSCPPSLLRPRPPAARTPNRSTPT